MKLTSTYILFIIFTLSGIDTCMAQSSGRPVIDTVAFIPGTRVIFEDDFTQDPIGQFPSKWRLYPTISTLEIDDSITNTGAYPISKQLHDSESVLAIASDNHYFPLKPKMQQGNYLDDTFTIQFDFRMDDPQSDPAIVLFDGNGNNIFECRLLGTGEIISTLLHQMRFSVDYPVPFDCKAWHHFAMSYTRRNIKCFLDRYRILVIPDCRKAPTNFIIAGNSYTDGNPVVQFKKIRVATGIPVYMFHKILTENKFTTNAIHFQKGRSDIEPESMDLIDQLADWLRTNNKVSLEIDGYTDNDGDAKTNIKLSKERAKAVQMALEMRGIDASRLTANGFGEGNPIESNATPEGKAKNRRVEFIKR